LVCGRTLIGIEVREGVGMSGGLNRAYWPDRDAPVSQVAPFIAKALQALSGVADSIGNLSMSGRDLLSKA
jgi:hypothetical protein